MLSLLLLLFLGTPSHASFCDEVLSSFLNKSTIKNEVEIFKKIPIEIREKEKFILAKKTLLIFESKFYQLFESDNVAWIEDSETDQLLATVQSENIICRDL